LKEENKKIKVQLEEITEKGKILMQKLQSKDKNDGIDL
jgi:hypothetical protein